MKNVDKKEETVKGEVLLSPIQYRFFESELVNPDHFNQSIILTSKEPINVSAVKECIKRILDNHDQLRATFEDKHQEIRERFEEDQYALYLFKIKDENLKSQLKNIGNEIQKHISLNKKRLICCGIIEGDSFHGLVICIHHLIIDGMSWNILIEDLNKIYTGYIQNVTVDMQKRTTSFKEWSEYLANYYQNGANNKELIYWRNITKQLENSKVTFDKEVLSTIKRLTVYN